ncbi:hypothetical protein GCK32_020457, partial [Trichostrongylus colubriformis]
MHLRIVSLVICTLLLNGGESQNYTCGYLPKEFDTALLTSINGWRGKFGFDKV